MVAFINRVESICITFGSVNNNLVAISGYDNSPGCFIAGTEIALANGDTKNIEDIIENIKISIYFFMILSFFYN